MRALLFATLLASLPLHAQDWPAKAVRIIVPFPAGGSADLMPRIVAEKLSEKWGQPVTVGTRPGAAGNIVADAVFRAEPDGYTLLSAPPPPLVINRLLYLKLSYDSTQFVPVTVIAANPNVLLVHPSLGVNSVAELIALARQNPGKLNYASQGSGSTSHLTAELFKSMAGGLQITHVPYKGTAPALTDLLAGQVDMMCDNLGVSLPHVRSGKLKALAVASKQRFAGLADAMRKPATNELGITDEQLVKSVEPQMKLQKERGSDLTIFSPRAAGMAHHVGSEATGIEWSRMSNDLIHRICTLLPDNFAPFGQLPQHPGVEPKNCVPELERLAKLGFAGVNLNPDPAGGYWTDPPFTEQWWYPH